MGNAQSLSKPTSNSKFNKYQVGQEFMVLHIDIQSESNDLTPWLALKQHRKHIYDNQLSLNTQLLKVIHDGVCNEKCTALLKADLFEHCIYDEISKRKTIGNFYSHEEVWLMLFKIVKLANNIYGNGPKWIIGNVHPKNVFINADGEVKIITLNSLPYQGSHYQMYRERGLDQAYISPELIGFTQNGHQNYVQFPSCVSKQISQVFTIGMCMLSICLLETNLDNLYKLESSKLDTHRTGYTEGAARGKKSTIHLMHSFSDLINKNLMQTYIDQIRSCYSNLLGTIIEAMLNPNPQKRLSLLYLYQQILQPQEAYILGMEINWLGSPSLASISYDCQESYKGIYSQRINSYFY